MSDYPEHEKLEQVQEQSQACGEFLEWLFSEKGYQVCEFVEGHDNGEPRYLTAGETKGGRTIYVHERGERYNGPDISTFNRVQNPAYCYTPTGYYPVRASVEDLLAQHFGLDRNKLEAEKRAMLAKLRAA